MSQPVLLPGPGCHCKHIQSPATTPTPGLQCREKRGPAAPWPHAPCQWQLYGLSQGTGKSWAMVTTGVPLALTHRSHRHHHGVFRSRHGRSPFKFSSLKQGGRQHVWFWGIRQGRFSAVDREFKGKYHLWGQCRITPQSGTGSLYTQESRACHRRHIINRSHLKGGKVVFTSTKNRFLLSNRFIIAGTVGSLCQGPEVTASTPEVLAGPAGSGA